MQHRVLKCGIRLDALFSQMDADGGMAKYSTNKAGAKYGTGYCDSQCPRDLKFINGAVRLLFFPDVTSMFIRSRRSRQTLLAGPLMPTRRTLGPASTDRAALRWIFGRPTLSRRRIPLTLVPEPLPRLNALERNAVPPRRESGNIQLCAEYASHLGFLQLSLRWIL